MLKEKMDRDNDYKQKLLKNYDNILYMLRTIKEHREKLTENEVKKGKNF